MSARPSIDAPRRDMASGAPLPRQSSLRRTRGPSNADRGPSASPVFVLSPEQEAHGSAHDAATADSSYLMSGASHAGLAKSDLSRASSASSQQMGSGGNLRQSDHAKVESLMPSKWWARGPCDAFLNFLTKPPGHIKDIFLRRRFRLVVGMSLVFLVIGLALVPLATNVLEIALLVSFSGLNGIAFIVGRVFRLQQAADHCWVGALCLFALLTALVQKDNNRIPDNCQTISETNVMKLFVVPIVASGIVYGTAGISATFLVCLVLMAIAVGTGAVSMSAWLSGVIVLFVIYLMMLAVVSFRKLELAEVIAERSNFDALFQASPDPMVVHSNGKILRCNANFLRTFGCSEKSAIGSSIDAFLKIPPLDANQSEVCFTSALSAFNAEIDRELEDDVGEDGNAIRLESGQSLASEDSARTDQRRNASRDDRLSAPIGIEACAMTMSGSEFPAETMSRRVFGFFHQRPFYSAEEQGSSNQTDTSSATLPLRGNDSTGHHPQASFSGGVSGSSEKDWSEVGSSSGSSFCDSRYVPISVFLTSIRNVSSQREAEVWKQRIEAEMSKRKMISDFVDTITHELRTPLWGILGSSEILLEYSEYEGESLDLMETIYRSAQTLLVLINDILDQSKFESGKLTLNKVQCDLCQLVEEVVEMLKTNALEKRIFLVPFLFLQNPCNVIQDPVRLKQILFNLLSNAIKFTNRPRGGVVWIACYLDALGRFVIASSDTGDGMSKESLARISRFERFVNIVSTSPVEHDGGGTSSHLAVAGPEVEDFRAEKRISGSGLGLNIINSLAAMMHGGIDVESEEGVGTVFRVYFQAECVRNTAEDSVLPFLFRASPKRAKAAFLVSDEEYWQFTHEVKVADEHIPFETGLPESMLSHSFARNHSTAYLAQAMAYCAAAGMGNVIVTLEMLVEETSIYAECSDFSLVFARDRDVYRIPQDAHRKLIERSLLCILSTTMRNLKSSRTAKLSLEGPPAHTSSGRKLSIEHHLDPLLSSGVPIAFLSRTGTVSLKAPLRSVEICTVIARSLTPPGVHLVSSPRLVPMSVDTSEFAASSSSVEVQLHSSSSSRSSQGMSTLSDVADSSILPSSDVGNSVNLSRIPAADGAAEGVASNPSRSSSTCATPSPPPSGLLSLHSSPPHRASSAQASEALLPSLPRTSSSPSSLLRPALALPSHASFGDSSLMVLPPNATGVTSLARLSYDGIVDPVRPIVLVVDDDPINRKVTAKMLDRLGYRCLCASSSIDALMKVCVRAVHFLLRSVSSAPATTLRHPPVTGTISSAEAIVNACEPQDPVFSLIRLVQCFLDHKVSSVRAAHADDSIFADPHLFMPVSDLASHPPDCLLPFVTESASLRHSPLFFDLSMLDMNMPLVNGDELGQWLRDLESLIVHSPYLSSPDNVVLLTRLFPVRSRSSSSASPPVMTPPLPDLPPASISSRWQQLPLILFSADVVPSPLPFQYTLPKPVRREILEQTLRMWCDKAMPPPVQSPLSSSATVTSSSPS